MAKKKNKYQKEALKKALSGAGDASAIAKTKDAATELGKDIVVGVIGGGVAGAALGRLSFVVGAAVTGVGHFAKSRIASVLGLGMMASGTYQSMAGMNGKPTSGLEGVKERLLSLRDDMKRRVFLDKVLKAKPKKTADEGTNGMGEVQYFLHPGNEEVGALDMSALDSIEKQIQESGERYSQVNGLQGQLSGEDEMGMVEPSDKLY